MKFVKGIIKFLFVVGVLFMITTLTFAVEHKHTFTEEIQSWRPNSNKQDNNSAEENSKIELKENKIIIH